jgi:hypothetical protein
MGRQAELFLQCRQRQSLPLMGLLHPAQHRFVAHQPAPRIEGFHHQPRRRVTVAAVAQLLPQLPPWLIRKQLPLIAAVEQCPGLAPQGIDQMIQINAPRPTMPLLTAMQTRQFAGEFAAQQDLQAVMIDPYRHP